MPAHPNSLNLGSEENSAGGTIIATCLTGDLDMRNLFLSGVISIGLLFGTVSPVTAATARTPAQQVRHKRHMKTVKRVGVGAVGGAAVGAVTGHPVAGAAVGAGAGALYDRHKKHKGGY